MAGGALVAASDEVIRKGKLAAAHLLQAGSSDVSFDVIDGIGRFTVVGRGVDIGELASTLRHEKITDLEGGLDSDATYIGKASTFPNGCHICEVELDVETGKTDIVCYRVLDDFGRIINPMLVRGQVHGGVVQGLGQALIENCIYDGQSGQLLTASFADYGIPRADDAPDIDFDYEEIPCKTNALGAKGCGEAGTVGALAAVVSAVCDAAGVAHIDMPMTPEKVWRAMHSGSA
jgi:aerobic carbon-monoxide dehydrogenase large subunit